MNRHHLRWLSLILGMFAGFVTLYLLLDDGLDKRQALSLFAAIMGALGLMFSLSALRRSGCPRQTPKR